ncbi:MULTISPECIES: TIGR03899 family protein [Gammaproteobacteria]|uniref:TIGR03899 family protein n=1 Tax=Gammaproteobacteria TaxID=1236 RepID=UPI000DD01B2E|nr:MULTISPECIES: TIGR03899 family protein [Gammaproteobacteria]RTE85656.1 TIGR03899 family protein [Aliidiomarina sp. B3213]TCZ89625.1 TIGR03899 family protein [Lysobacter sp. N42]
MKSVTQIQQKRAKLNTLNKLALSLDSLGVLPRDSDNFFGNLAERASNRASLFSEMKQQNIEAITALALEKASSPSLAPPETDWLMEFIELAERSSNPRMQELWAKVLVAESMAPGTFSLRTLRLLAKITPYEAAILRKAKSITVLDYRLKRSKIIIGTEARPPKWNVLQPPLKRQINLAKSGLNYPDLLTLMDIGILHGESIESGLLKVGESLKFQFNGDVLQICPMKPNSVLNYLKYTMVGEELCKLTKVEPNSRYMKSLEENLHGIFSLQRTSTR